MRAALVRPTPAPNNKRIGGKAEQLQLMQLQTERVLDEDSDSAARPETPPPPTPHLRAQSPTR